ncbi:MAG: YegS/Rv2252/BmrU family lipid kinase [Clostridia bacterium]|nr:YegS/Rv2252/BmrU family lipid kinase [Clostridia bacterium]
MKKLLFVFNPHSGTGEICKHLANILDIFTKSGYEVTAYPTQAARDGMNKVISDGERFDRIVVSGGDGTLHELVNAVMRLSKPIPVGYIPTGTVNDFASTNAIPKNNIEAAQIAVSNNIKSLDLGCFNGEYFSYVAAFGVATNISYDTDQKAKNTWGVLAYLANAVKTINPLTFNSFCHNMTIKTDSEILEGEYAFGAISNSMSIAGMSNLTGRDVVLDDGLLEGLFIKKPQNIFEFDEIRNALLFRDFDYPCISYVKSSRFEISSDGVAWTLDGENGGEHRDLTVTAKKQALNIALPEEK